MCGVTKSKSRVICSHWRGPECRNLPKSLRRRLPSGKWRLPVSLNNRRMVRLLHLRHICGSRIPKTVLSEFSPFAATLASFATFGVAFFARPIGGVVFGHFGDRIGRKSMLVITLLIMGGATFLIGLVPTFEQAGWAAPIFLVVLRFLQGFAVGGEWGGATLIVVEHAPKERRNFYASWPQTGLPVGLMLSTAVFAAFSLLPDEQFFSWGWRVPFLLSIVLIAVGLFIRLRVLESPVFSRVKALAVQSKVPLIEVLRDYPVSLVLAVGAVLGLITRFYVVTTFTLVYATEQLGVSRNVPLLGLLLFAAAQLAGIVIFARVADRNQQAASRALRARSLTCCSRTPTSG